MAVALVLFWVVGTAVPSLGPDLTATLDLSSTGSFVFVVIVVLSAVPVAAYELRRRRGT